MQCPSRNEFSACLLGRLPDARTAVLLDHAERCHACRVVVEALEHDADRLTDSLRIGGSQIQVTEACERMMSRAEKYVAPESTVDEARTTSRHLLQGTVVRDYEIVRPLGEGGMGAVFLARHQRLGRNVALKVLSLRRAADVEAQRRFEQEMTIVGKLQHPGIVRALDAGEQAGVQYLVMELIDGLNLRQLIELSGQIPLADACEICRLTALALHYAHQQHLIHRDLKPSNIMLATDGTARILDLGLARWTDDQRVALTSTEQAVGSLDYMAPEQLSGGPIDQRADIFGLACTLHFLFCGEPPQKRRTAALMVTRGPRLEQLRESLPPPLTRLMQRMLAVEPEKRIASAAEVAEQLAPFCASAALTQLAEEAAAMGTPFEAAPISGSITSEVSLAATPKTRRTRWRAAVVVALALVATVALAFALTQGAADTRSFQLGQLPSVTSVQQPAQEIPLFQLHAQAVRCVAYCSSTSQLICGSDDASVSVRDIPHQRRISVICQFDSPVRRICVATDVPRALCLDELGAIALVELPASRVVGYLPAGEFEHRPVEVALLSDGDTIIISHADGTLRAFTMSSKELLTERSTPHGLVIRMFVRDDGRSLVTLDQNGFIGTWTLPDLQPENILAHVESPKLFLVATGNGRIECLTTGYDRWFEFLGTDTLPPCVVSTPETIRTVDMLHPFVPCIVHTQSVRIIDLSLEQPEQFIYVEHSHPLTVVHSIAVDELIVTGDESGKVRLWNAPNQPTSDMLLLSGVSVDSRVMTHALRQHSAWSRKAFETTPDSVVSITQRPGEGMTITTKIVRNGREHTLEYQVNTQPSDQNE